MKYSVIIPAYQAENTIARCLDSLLTGIRDDAELLIVDDGSTDRTADICREYASRYPRIRCFFREHTGVSDARNLALEHAVGKYILFVDSDDYVLPDYFGVIDQNLSEDTDFLMFGKVVSDGAVTRLYPLCERRMDDPEDTMKFLSKALVHQKLNALHTKVFRREILLKYGIRFDERLSIGEDKVFVVQYLVHVQNAVLIREPLYALSIENEHSLSRKKRVDLCDHILLEHQLLFEAAEGSEHCAILKKAVSYSYHRSAYTVIRKLAKFDYPRSQRLAQTREICRKYAARKDCSYLNFQHWLISVPIRLGMAGLIDFLLRKKR